MSDDNPIARRVTANGALHHVLEWGLEWNADLKEGGPIAMLLHGFMDAASTWDLVAPYLVGAGLRVIAPDLRGFGDSPWSPPGSYYHFPEYVADVADLVDELVRDAPLFLVGHSMGGTVASLFAGAFPDRVKKLALLEGVGPPDNSPDVAPHRMRRWIEDQRKLRSEPPRAMRREDALRRLAARHANVDRNVIASRLRHLASPVSDTAEDLVTWKFDPLHRATSPFPFFASTYRAFASRVTAPVLIVSGGSDGFHTPDEDERIHAFCNYKTAEIPGAGHMMHWTKPEALSKLLVDFWSA